MHVSREIDYGVRAVVAMASRPHEVLSKRRIALAYDVPVNFLSIILPKLVHEGIIESLPGPRGGYRLARSPERISLHDIIAAIEPDFTLNRCSRARGGCSRRARCSVAPHWEELQRLLEASLKGITFDRLAERL